MSVIFPGLRQYPTSGLAQDMLPSDIVCGLVCLDVPTILRRRMTEYILGLEMLTRS